MVPLNRIGSWRMMDSRDLRVCRGSLEMSMLSITILPVWQKFTKTPRFHQLRHFSSFFLLFQLLFYPLWRHESHLDYVRKGIWCKNQTCRSTCYPLWISKQPKVDVYFILLTFFCAGVKPKWYFTLKHVHHAEEGQGERGFTAAGPATDPHLGKKAKTVIIIIIINLSIHSLSSLLVWEACG